MKKRPAQSYDYLKALEAKERASRRVRWLAGGIVLVVAAACLAWVGPYYGFPEQHEEALSFRRLPGEYLTESRVKQLFQGDPRPVLVRYKDRKAADTLYRYEDFLAIYPKNRDRKEAHRAIFAVETFHGLPSSDAAERYGFKVQGELLAGENLSFQILNFHPGTTFEFDFGDGSKAAAGERISHAFERPGVYRVDLWVGKQDRDPVLFATAMVAVQDPQDHAKRSAKAGTRSEKRASPVPLEKAEVMPSFPGGKTAMYAFIQKNLRYPRTDLGERKEGPVHARFLVDEQGLMADPVILHSLGEAYDAEFLRILRLMPPWEPGVQDGQKVPVYYDLRVNFDWTP